MPATASAAATAAPLPPAAFADWWFAPECGDVLPGAPQQTGLLARRDGYRLHCRRDGLPPALPPFMSAGWPLALGLGAGLRPAARLYAGLLAAREHDAAALSRLAPADRAWCLRLAATQPLRACAPGNGGADLTLRGLAELACHLERDFPGLWPRLRLALDQPTRDGVAALLPSLAPPAAMATARAQRCWLACRRQAGA